MPRIVSLRVFKVLWVAFELDDYERACNIKMGWTEQQARQRAAWSDDG